MKKKPEGRQGKALLTSFVSKTRRTKNKKRSVLLWYGKKHEKKTEITVFNGSKKGSAPCAFRRTAALYGCRKQRKPCRKSSGSASGILSAKKNFSAGKPTTYGGGLAKLDSSGNVKKRKRTYNPVCEPVKASHRRKICPNTKV